MTLSMSCTPWMNAQLYSKKCYEIIITHNIMLSFMSCSSHSGHFGGLPMVSNHNERHERLSDFYEGHGNRSEVKLILFLKRIPSLGVLFCRNALSIKTMPSKMKNPDFSFIFLSKLSKFLVNAK